MLEPAEQTEAPAPEPAPEPEPEPAPDPLARARLPRRASRGTRAAGAAAE